MEYAYTITNIRKKLPTGILTYKSTFTDFKKYFIFYLNYIFSRVNYKTKDFMKTKI